jgi:hypothetical protein
MRVCNRSIRRALVYNPILFLLLLANIGISHAAEPSAKQLEEWYASDELVYPRVDHVNEG